MRLCRGPDVGEEPVRGFLVSLVVRGSLAAEAIARAKELLREVVELPVDAFVSGHAAAVLPEWFTQTCAPEESEEERAAWLQWWRSLDDDAQARAASEQRWTVDDWLYWMRPEERQWWWWDSRVANGDSGIVWVEVAGWPAAVGSLLWLLRAGGAEGLVVDDLG